MIIAMLVLILFAVLFPGFLRWLLSLTALLFVGAVLAGMAHAEDTPKAALEAYVTCLENGDYSDLTSADGGRSAMHLAVGQCKDTWSNYIQECIKRGSTDGSCTLISVELAQIQLKHSGK